MLITLVSTMAQSQKAKRDKRDKRDKKEKFDSGVEKLQRTCTRTHVWVPRPCEFLTIWRNSVCSASSSVWPCYMASRWMKHFAASLLHCSFQCSASRRPMQRCAPSMMCVWLLVIAAHTHASVCIRAG